MISIRLFYYNSEKTNSLLLKGDLNSENECTSLLTWFSYTYNTKIQNIGSIFRKIEIPGLMESFKKSHSENDEEIRRYELRKKSIVKHGIKHREETIRTLRKNLKTLEEETGL